MSLEGKGTEASKGRACSGNLAFGSGWRGRHREEDSGVTVLDGGLPQTRLQAARRRLDSAAREEADN